MIKEDQKFKKLRARKTKRNMKCKQLDPQLGTDYLTVSYTYILGKLV